ncbi:alpha/beta hydrolase [Ectothiorhodospiraceae bacterium WFHF3C12]|nr:alpha/beta hydrolase [Ectothiorhodospiraceae bacterium WFHF3C12]
MTPSQKKTVPPAAKFPARAGVILATILALLAAGCASPRLQPAREPFTSPAFAGNHIRFADGYRSPVRRWLPAGKPDRLVLALHGFNDHSRAFEPLGSYLSARGTAVFAYDQRGFGGSPYRGIWPGTDRLVDDAVQAMRALRVQYPEQPLFLVGESMGGAVAMLAARGGRPELSGLVLLAPAVWGRDAMSPFTRAALWLSVRTMPGRKWTGESLDIQPTDNLDALRRMARDPLFIKGTRTDALWGITNLMDRASAGAGAIDARALVLYGLNDDIIPKPPTCRLLQRLAPRQNVSVLLYPNGYHLLLQDRQAGNVLGDIHAWTRQPTPLPQANYRLSDDAWRSALCGED